MDNIVNSNKIYSQTPSVQLYLGSTSANLLTVFPGAPGMSRLPAMNNKIHFIWKISKRRCTNKIKKTHKLSEIQHLPAMCQPLLLSAPVYTCFLRHTYAGLRACIVHHKATLPHSPSLSHMFSPHFSLPGTPGSFTR